MRPFLNSASERHSQGMTMHGEVRHAQTPTTGSQSAARVDCVVLYWVSGPPVVFSNPPTSGKANSAMCR
jgi:hypothetical protein